MQGIYYKHSNGWTLCELNGYVSFWMTHQSHQSFWLSSIRFELGSCKGQNAQRTQNHDPIKIIQPNSHPWKTWFTKKSPNWKGTSSSKPSFLCNMVIFPGCTPAKCSFDLCLMYIFRKNRFYHSKTSWNGPYQHIQEQCPASWWFQILFISFYF